MKFKDQINGIVRPRPGTLSRQVWDRCDYYFFRDMLPVRKHVLKDCADIETPGGSVSYQINRWRLYRDLRKTKSAAG